MKTREYILAALVLIASGCSKNQARTNRIEGNWKVTGVQQFAANGTKTVATDAGGVFHFESCKLKKENYCPYVQQSNYTLAGRSYPTDVSGEFSVTTKGRRLELHEFNADGTFDEVVYYIMVLNNKEMQLENVDANGSKTVVTLER